MQAGDGYAKITIKELIPGGKDGSGNNLPGTEITVLETRCSYRQISSQITIQAYQAGTNKVFEVRFRKRAAYTENALTQHAILFGEKYSIIRPNGDRRDHVFTLIKRD